MRSDRKRFFQSRSKLMTTVVALAAIAAAGYWITSPNKRPNGEIWFYDLKTHQLFTASDLSVPPIDTKSGPETGVRAYVCTCDADPKSTNRFIAYLEKFTPELKQVVGEDMKRRGGQPPNGMLLDRHPGGILVSSPEVEHWFPNDSDKGRRLVEMGKKKGGCANPTLHHP